MHYFLFILLALAFTCKGNTQPNQNFFEQYPNVHEQQKKLFEYFPLGSDSKYLVQFLSQHASISAPKPCKSEKCKEGDQHIPFSREVRKNDHFLWINLGEQWRHNYGTITVTKGRKIKDIQMSKKFTAPFIPTTVQTTNAETSFFKQHIYKTEQELQELLITKFPLNSFLSSIENFLELHADTIDTSKQGIITATVIQENIESHSHITVLVTHNDRKISNIEVSKKEIF
ncbi:MAG: hypothetical protein OXR68_07910 [Alphaproteobacteria bacterium]|nr:hypothetical protein [Alphaproteobacteria bacterium]